MRYLVTGVKGQLGYDIVKELNKRGITDIAALDIDDMDITNKEEVDAVIKKYNPDVIYHCAAWTNVDKAQTMENIVMKVNVGGVKNITDASIKVGAKLFYISTDYVFDGTANGLYDELDIPRPMNIYGLTKYLGELEAKKNPKHFITRISWVFGINGNNFVKTMLKLSETHDMLTVVDDQIGSPTYTVDLAKVLVDMADTDKYGLYHINNDGYCSWAEFAKYIMESNNKSTIIKPVTTEEYYKGKDTSTIAYRPRNSKLSKQKLIDNGFTMLPDWHDAVDRYNIELEEQKVLVKK